MSAATTLSPILNETLIKRALDKCHKVNSESSLVVKACDFKLSPASGDNFCSDIFQVDVQYELNGNAKEMSLLIKIMLPEIAAVGSNEEIMFTTVLPGMESLLNANVGDTENKLSAKCLLSEREKEEFYILENLNTLGYFCADREKGLDMEHGQVLMQKIAKFHSASMIYEKKFPDIVQSLGASHFANGATDDTAKSITFGGLEYVANMIETWPSYEHLAHRIKSIMPKFNQLVAEVANSKNSIFNVITHGDLWVNNFLYKYDEQTNKPIDVIFVDFQNCFWGSCGFDINYFLNTSLELKFLKENRQDFIITYYNTLKDVLERSKYPLQEIPTKTDVFDEIRRCEFIGFYAALCELPIVALEKSKCKGFNCNTFGQPEEMKTIRVLMYENPRVKETLEYTLKYFEELNIL